MDFLSDMHIFCTFQPNVYLLILELFSNFIFFKINVPFISEWLGVGKGRLKYGKEESFKSKEWENEFIKLWVTV